MATTLTGTNGTLTAASGAGGGSGTGAGGAGSVGRLRLEAYTYSGTFAFNPTPTVTIPGSATLSGNPTLTITSVGGVNSPAIPAGGYGAPDITLPSTTTNPVTANLAATNIPTGTTVTVRITPQEGQSSTATSTALAGTLASSTATASVTLPLDQPAALDAEATFTLQASLDSPIKYAGEDVVVGRVTASLGGPSTVRYFTASGKEVTGEALGGLGLSR